MSKPSFFRSSLSPKIIRAPAMTTLRIIGLFMLSGLDSPSVFASAEMKFPEPDIELETIPEKPVFPDKYTVTFVKEIPFANISMPVKIALDMAGRQERIDFYHGLQTHFLDSSGIYEYVYAYLPANEDISKSKKSTTKTARTAMQTKRMCYHNMEPHEELQVQSDTDTDTDSASSQQKLKFKLSVSDEFWVVVPFPTNLDKFQYAGRQGSVDKWELNQQLFETEEGEEGEGEQQNQSNQAQAFYYDSQLKQPVKWVQYSHGDERSTLYVDFVEGEFKWELPVECKTSNSKEEQKQLWPVRANRLPVEFYDPMFTKVMLPRHGTSKQSQQLKVHKIVSSENKSYNADLDQFLESEISPNFRHFALTYGKANTYSTITEWKKRQEVFEFNSRKIKQLNVQHKRKTKFQENEFLDLTLEEFLRLRGGGGNGLSSTTLSKRASISSSTQKQVEVQLPSKRHSSASSSSSRTSIHQQKPENFDYRVEHPGAIPPIRDQAQCGSCWAFSLTSAIESFNYLKNGVNITDATRLPEQFFVDCSWSKYNAACDGGIPGRAAEAIIQYFDGVIPSAQQYGAYLGVDGYCSGVGTGSHSHIGGQLWNTDGNQNQIQNQKRFTSMPNHDGKVQTTSPSTSAVNVLKLKSWFYLPFRQESLIFDALLNQGPLSVGYEVNAESAFYKEGILDTENCNIGNKTDLNHLVNLIGYGTDNRIKDEKGHGLDFWVLRNSWGVRYGEEGYFRVVRGVRDCGVTTEAGYPVLESGGEDFMGEGNDSKGKGTDDGGDEGSGGGMGGYGGEVDKSLSIANEMDHYSEVEIYV